MAEMGMDGFEEEIYDATQEIIPKAKYVGQVWKLPTHNISFSDLKLPTYFSVENVDDVNNIKEDEINALNFGRGRGLGTQIPRLERMVQTTTAFDETSKIAQSLRSAYPAFKSTMTNRKIKGKINTREVLPSKDQSRTQNKPNGHYNKNFYRNGDFIKLDKSEYISSLDNQSVSHLIEDYYEQSSSCRMGHKTVEAVNLLKAEDFPPIGSTDCNSPKKSLGNGGELQTGKELKQEKIECTTREDNCNKSSSSVSCTPCKNSDVNGILNINSTPVLMKFIINFLPSTVSYEYLYDFMVSYGRIESLELNELFSEMNSSSNATLKIWVDEYNKNMLMDFMNSDSTEDIFEFPESGPKRKIQCEIQPISCSAKYNRKHFHH